MKIGRVVYGDNQFLGVNHYSTAQASEYSDRFKNDNEILRCLDAAYEAGVRDFMFTIHPRYERVFKIIIEQDRYPEMYFSPCLPYAHAYNDLLADKGLRGVATKLLRSLDYKSLIDLPSSLVKHRLGSGVSVLAAIEMSAVKHLRLRNVFLQNIFFDSLLALEHVEAINAFERYVRKRCGAIPGYITMNPCRAIDFLTSDVGIIDPVVCANLNETGQRVNPSRQAVQDSIDEGNCHFIAMSIFAGSSDWRQSADFVRNNSGVDSILFGSGNVSNITSTVERLNGL